MAGPGEPFARLGFPDFDRSLSRASLVGAWALGLLANAESNVTAIYLYAQPTEGSSDTAVFLGAVAPDQADQSSAEAGRARLRARFVLALSELSPGTYSVIAFAQTLSGAPYELGSITLVIR